MESALAEIEFLVGSSNRIAVLSELADGPRTRRDLAGATGASQATLGRILGDFEERSWVRKDGSRYEATATGRLVVRGFEDLVDIVETERELRDVVHDLPTKAMDFDPRHLVDATLTVPTETRPNAPLQRLLDLTRAAGTVRTFSHAFNEQSLDLTAGLAARGDVRFEGVFSRSAIESVASDSDLRARLETLLDAGSAEIRICDDEIPVAGTILDGVVHLLVRDDTGVLRASLEVENPAVREWAVETFETYWEVASPLDRTDL